MIRMHNRTIEIAGSAARANAFDQRGAANSDSSNRIDEAPAEHANDKCVHGLARVACLSLAAVLFAIGLLGIVVPGLPATPFFLLTAYLLDRSWPRMHATLLRSVLIGQILNDWQQYRGLRPRTKARVILVIAISLAITCSFSGLAMGLRAIVAVVAVAGLVVVYRMPIVKVKSFASPPPSEPRYPIAEFAIAESSIAT